ncbi:hypothetical protein [Mycobacterium sp. NPDC050853]|uniref:hypothetical protein n=1 Tax=Mycobacteriaceae TaxID=1762 RepID=UPI0015DF1535|nr:hypothetical protein [Mycobacteroides sp. LB1]
MQTVDEAMRLIKVLVHSPQAPMMSGRGGIRIAVDPPFGLGDLFRYAVYMLMQGQQQGPSLRNRCVFSHAGMVAPFSPLFATAPGRSGNEPQQP